MMPQEAYDEGPAERSQVLNDPMTYDAKSVPGPTDLLENEGARETLMAIMAGNKTTKAVAGALDISPSAASEQIHKLNDAGLVKRGEKVGKYQFYDINDDALNSAAREKQDEYRKLTS
jgi:DNA-binding transcriptional ArsR family regulator